MLKVVYKHELLLYWSCSCDSRFGFKRQKIKKIKLKHTSPEIITSNSGIICLSGIISLHFDNFTDFPGWAHMAHLTKDGLIGAVITSSNNTTQLITILHSWYIFPLGDNFIHYLDIDFVLIHFSQIIIDSREWQFPEIHQSIKARQPARVGFDGCLACLLLHNLFYVENTCFNSVCLWRHLFSS